MKKALVCIGITLAFMACKSNKDVSFSVYNDASDKIFVHYYTFENQDTQVVELIPGDLTIMLEGKSINENSNWFYDYKLKILNIYNLVGDSINFDANVSYNWSLFIGEPFYYYQLHIEDTDF